MKLRSFVMAAACAALSAEAVPTLDGCPVFPANNFWNTRVDSLPLHPRSAAWVASIGATTLFHMDFGGGFYPDPPDPDAAPIGIPFTSVLGSQPRVNVTFTDYGDESDASPNVPAPQVPPGSGTYQGQYPYPSNAPIEGVGPANPNTGGDRHVLVVDRTNCILYETGNSYPQAGGAWLASGGAVYNLNANGPLRPLTWTSADAAGLAILPGLARYDEAAAGEIQHALRFTAPTTQRAFIWPARHQAGFSTSLDVPPMGARFRLRASYNMSGFSPRARAIAQAMKTYGIVLADNGSRWYVSGAPDNRWDNDELHQLDVLRGSDFEVVDTAPLMIDANSGEACQPGDADNDGIPSCLEPREGRSAATKDNDVFGSARLFAMQQYRDFLGREGDPAGVDFWTGQVGTAQTRAQVTEAFFNSSEFQGSIAPVARLYFAYFLRIPDYSGLSFWAGYYRDGNPLANIANFFAQSTEFTTAYGSLSNGDFVTLVYNNVLGRAPDAGGLAYWKGQLDTNARTRGQVMLGFSESEEFRAAMAAEVFVTMTYMGMLRRAPEQGGFDFWVDYLEGGSSGLALIGGFLGSTEYRLRFLPQ